MTLRVDIANQHHPRAFTLIELMVVVTLVSIFVTATAVSLDGVTARGRLRSAARQIAAVNALARTEATSSGRPRLLVFGAGWSRCEVQEPEFDGRRWGWSDGRAFPFATRVTLNRLLVESAADSDDRHTEWTVRVAGDGTSPSYACVLTAGDVFGALLIDGVTGQGRFIESVDPGVSDLADVASVGDEP